MNVFEQMAEFDHEQLVYGYDKETGLKTIIAIHDTTLGPAGGGTRFWNYDTEQEALYDVLRLARGMSLKNAGAGLKLGGGKAVIIGDPKKMKTKELLHAYGRIVDSLGGKYYTAEDVNINEHDIKNVSAVTKYVMGTPEISGNPSPLTARGVYRGLKAGAKMKFGTDDLKGMVVALQGLGSVGYRLAEYLHADGAILKVFDINKEVVDKAVANLDATMVPGDELMSTECDIFSPCALGAVFNSDNVKTLKCKMICGAANNQLVVKSVGDDLEALDILYLPDFIVNAGGIINCAGDVETDIYDAEGVKQKVEAIYDTTTNIIKLAKEKGVSTAEAAEMYSMGIIMAARK